MNATTVLFDPQLTNARGTDTHRHSTSRGQFLSPGEILLVVPSLSVESFEQHIVTVGPPGPDRADVVEVTGDEEILRIAIQTVGVSVSGLIGEEEQDDGETDVDDDLSDDFSHSDFS